MHSVAPRQRQTGWRAGTFRGHWFCIDHIDQANQWDWFQEHGKIDANSNHGFGVGFCQASLANLQWIFFEDRST